MTDEITIREALSVACAKRGVQAEISKAFNVSQSTVKRWLEGGEIPPPMLKLLDWYFFGTLPPRLSSDEQVPSGMLDFSPEEWNIVLILAARAGQSPAKWIASTIRFHLDLHQSASRPQSEPETLRFELPFRGYAAAGSPVTSQTEGESVQVPKEYPAGYFVIEVNGASMEPTLPDGCRIICEPREYTPKHGKICIISDGHGASVKRYDSTRKAFVSDNPAFPEFTPAGDAKLQGYFAEMLTGNAE